MKSGPSAAITSVRTRSSRTFSVAQLQVGDLRVVQQVDQAEVLADPAAVPDDRDSSA